MTRIGIDVTTERPADDVVIESAEQTGIDAFEEGVNADDMSRLQSASHSACSKSSPITL